VKLLEQLVGGERERAHELKAAATNGAVELGVARGGEEGAACIGRLTLGDDG
jgi:hypothetical protein